LDLEEENVRRHIYSVAAVAAAALVGTSAAAFGAAVRVDVNGEFVGDNNNNGFPNNNVPSNWTVYGTGTGGGQVYTYNQGNASNVFCVQNEDEDAQRALIVNTAGQVGVYPAGHGLLFGGNTTGTASTWGVGQTIASTAGKVYWISGAQGASADWSTAQQQKYAFDWGMENGGSVAGGGLLSSGNIRRSGGGLQDGRFSHAIVATGSQVTAHVGLRCNTTNVSTDINAYADGVRVYAIDVPVNPSLQNGSFEGGSTDISNYNAKGIAGNGGTYAQQDLIDGWIPLGGGAAQRQRYNLDNVLAVSGNSFQIDQNKGYGRTFAMQRVDAGDAGSTYLLSGSIRNDSAESNSLIGIDPTGGTDPTSASIIWSTAGAIGAFGAVTVNGGVPVTDLTGNGVTVFLASGYNGANNRSGGDSGGRFDNLALAIVPVPEPTALAAIALAAGVPLLRRSRRQGA
jgi:hypothetical protein